MANIDPAPSWANIRRLETTDRNMAGPGGILNDPTTSIAARLNLLRDNDTTLGNSVAAVNARQDATDTAIANIQGQVLNAPGTLSDLENGAVLDPASGFPDVPSVENARGPVDAINESIEALTARTKNLRNGLDEFNSESGAALVGFTRTPTAEGFGPDGTLGSLANSTSVFLTEYQEFAVKSGPNPSSWNWIPAIQAALADIYENYRGCTLVFPPISMTFPGTDGIVIDLSRLSVDFNGCQILAPNLAPGNAAVTITRLSEESDGSQFQLGRFSILNLSIKGAGLPADGSDPATYSVGLRWASPINGTSVRFSTYNLTISDIGIAEQFLDRAYLVHHYKTSLSNSGICIDMPSGRSDYGENISYFGGVFSGGKFCEVTNTLSDFFFYGVSFDYPKHPNALYLFRFDGVANFYGCHLEVGNEFNPLTGLDHYFHLGSAASVVVWDGGWVSAAFAYVGAQYFVAQAVDSSFTIKNAYCAGIIPAVAMSNRPGYYRQQDMKLYRPNPGISYKGSANFYQTITAAGGSTLAGTYGYDSAASPRVSTALVSGNVEITLTTIETAVGRGVRILIPIPRGAVGMDAEFESFARAASTGASVVTVEGYFAMFNKAASINAQSPVVRRTAVFSLAAQNLATGPITRTLPASPRAVAAGMNIPDYAEYFVFDISLYGATEPTLGTPSKFTLSGLKIHAY